MKLKAMWNQWLGLSQSLKSAQAANNLGRRWVGTHGPAAGAGGRNIFREQCWEERGLNVLLRQKWPFQTRVTLGGNRSAICFSTCYAGSEFVWKLWIAVLCQPWALMYSWKNHNIVPPGLVLGRLLETPVANDLFRQLCHPDLVFRSMHRWPGANALYTSTTMCTSLVLLRHRIHNIDVRSYLVLSTLNLCRPVETCLIYTSKLIEEVITHNSQSFHHLTQWGMKTLFCLDCNCLYIPENTIPYSQFFVKTPQVCR